MTDMHRQSSLRIFGQLRLRQPRSLTLDAHGFAGEQIGNEPLAQFQIAKGITAGRVEQARAETQLAAGGDRRSDFKHGGNLPRHHIHPTETAQ
ncbi:hypothetical protein D3C86_1687200 [compost metagenome]